MPPPVVRGRALVAQRLKGLVFLAVLAGLIGLSIASYQKAFTPWLDVTLQADRIGNQLTQGADVKARGVIVGEVRSVEATDDGTELRLRLDPDKATLVPQGTAARILPTTLFGEKFVALVFDDPAGPGEPSLSDGDVIAQDRSSTARETSEALDSLLPLLQTLEPDTVSTTLNAVSSALRGRGDRIGSNLVLARDYLSQFNPELGRLQANLAGTADLTDTLDAAAPDILALLDDVSAINRNLVRDQAAIDRVLRDTAGVAATAEEFTAENEQRFITLARESVPNLEVYARYAPQLPCLLDGIVRQLPRGEAFGGLQPGLHITLELTEDNGSYVPGDESAYGEDVGPRCFGLDGDPIVPFPITIKVTDGYCDEYEQANEGVQTECVRDEDSGRQSGPTPFSPAAYDRAALRAQVAPALGLTPPEVPDVAVLLSAPLTERRPGS